MRLILGALTVVSASIGGYLFNSAADDGQSATTSAAMPRMLLEVAAKPQGTVQGKLDAVDVGPVKAIEFDGRRDRIVVAELTPNERAGLPQRAFSVGGWVNVRTTSRWGGIVGALQDNGDAERGWLLGFENDRFSFGLSTEGADDGDGVMTYMAGRTPIETGRWYHVVASYDGKTMQLFVNGKLDAESKEQSGDVLYPAKATFVVGAYVDADEDYPFSGWVHSLELEGDSRSTALVAEQFKTNAQWAAYRHEIAAPTGGPAFVVQPYLQFPTQNTIRVMWETSAAATSVVEYGTTDRLEHDTETAGTAKIHDVLIEGLEPRTQYFYRVRSELPDGGESVSEIFTLQTAVHDDDAYAFTVIGDTQYNPTVTGKIANLCYGMRPNFQVHAGDLVSTGGIKQQWVEHFFAPSQPLMSRVAVYPVLGNHEQNAHWFYDYFSLPDPEYHYTFTYGNAQFFMLDTNKPVGPGSPQQKWLDAELAKSRATWKFAVHHHPIWSSDSNDYGNTYKGTSTWGKPEHRTLAKLYESHGVDIVFNGHVHMYERTWPLTGVKVDDRNGVRYITTGGSGGGLEAFAPSRTWFMAQGARVHHFCYLAIHGGKLQFRAFDVDGRMFDEFELSKP